jgi:hypothetical protein
MRYNDHIDEVAAITMRTGEDVNEQRCVIPLLKLATESHNEHFSVQVIRLLERILPPLLPRILSEDLKRLDSIHDVFQIYHQYDKDNAGHVHLWITREQAYCSNVCELARHELARRGVEA